MPGHAASAIMDPLLGGDLHIQQIVYQFEIYHLPIDRLDARRSADQVCDLVCVQLFAYQLLKRDNLSGLFIRPPACFLPASLQV